MPQDADAPMTDRTTTDGRGPSLPAAPGEPLLSVRDLRVAFGSTEVLHGVDLDVRRGERVAIVGQSGSGKSTLIAAVLRLLPGAGHVTGGSIRLGDLDVAGADESAMRRVRGGRIGLVPQDPSTNLNPSMRVGAQIADTLRAGGMRGRSATC